MIMLRFPALPFYTGGRTIDEQTVLIALNCMVACLAHVSFIFSLLLKTLRVTISFQLNIRLCLCAYTTEYECQKI